jgi:hypothetical protein
MKIVQEVSLIGVGNFEESNDWSIIRAVISCPVKDLSLRQQGGRGALEQRGRVFGFLHRFGNHN